MFYAARKGLFGGANERSVASLRNALPPSWIMMRRRLGEVENLPERVGIREKKQWGEGRVGGSEGHCSF